MISDPQWQAHRLCVPKIRFCNIGGEVRELFVFLEPIREVLESDESDVIPCRVPSRVVLEFGDAISGISRVSGQAARSIGCARHSHLPNWLFKLPSRTSRGCA